MVYVVQQTNQNITSAVEYGKIKFLIDDGNQYTFSPGQLVRSLMRRLCKFCDDDYLLLIGDPVAIGIATTVAAHWNKGKVKMLKWDRQNTTYIPIEMDLYAKEPFNDPT